MPIEVRKDALDAIAAEIAGLSKAGWAVAPAIAEFSARNPAFKRVEAALRRYLDQNRDCFHSIYMALGGQLEDLQGDGPAAGGAGGTSGRHSGTTTKTNVPPGGSGRLRSADSERPSKSRRRSDA